MALNAANVFIGTPEQSATVGALSRGDVLTTIPADYTAAKTAIASFEMSGYISEDGATLTIDKSTNGIIEWARKQVRRTLDSVDATIGCTLLQMDAQDAKFVFGDSNVSTVAAGSGHGNQMKISVGASLDEPHAWALRIKDGDFGMIVLCPNGQVTSGIDMTFAADQAINMPVTISANSDDAGQLVYIYTDDGLTA